MELGEDLELVDVSTQLYTFIQLLVDHLGLILIHNLFI